MSIFDMHKKRNHQLTDLEALYLAFAKRIKNNKDVDGLVAGLKEKQLIPFAQFLRTKEDAQMAMMVLIACLKPYMNYKDAPRASLILAEMMEKAQCFSEARVLLEGMVALYGDRPEIDEIKACLQRLS